MEQPHGPHLCTPLGHRALLVVALAGGRHHSLHAALAILNILRQAGEGGEGRAHWS